MDCQYGCGRRCVVKLDACVPCYKLVHGERTANNIIQWIKKKQFSENEAIFKVERFLLERALVYLKNRLEHILGQMCVENSGRCSRKLLRRMKQVPQDLLVSLNRYYQANPHEDDELLESLDNELSFRCARRYGRSSSDEETESVPEGNREEAVASCSGKLEEKKRKHSPNRVFPSAEIPVEENDENLENIEPPKKKQAQKIEKPATGVKRLHSALNLEVEEDRLESPSKKRAGEANEDVFQEAAQQMKQKRFRKKKRSELELLKVGLPLYFETKIVLSPIPEASSPPATPQAVAPIRQQCGTIQGGRRGRPRKQPCNRLRNNLGMFVKDENKVRPPPRPKVRRRRTELELLKAGLPLFFQS